MPTPIPPVAAGAGLFDPNIQMKPFEESVAGGRLPAMAELEKMGLAQRLHSPIGADEWSLDPRVTKHYLAPGAAASTRGTTILYDRRFADMPETQNHERIHVGQNRLPNELDPVSVVRAVGSAWEPNPGITPRTVGYELPAYTFESSGPPFTGPFSKEVSPQRQREIISQNTAKHQRIQEAFNAYLDTAYRKYPGQTPAFETSMPAEFLREYVKNHPRPLALLPPVGLR